MSWVRSARNRILVKLFSGAKIKAKHKQQFQKQARRFNDKVRPVTQDRPGPCWRPRKAASEPYAAIEAVISLGRVHRERSARAELAGPGRQGFDHLHLVGENFATLRRYTPALLEVLESARRPGCARRCWRRADPARDERTTKPAARCRPMRRHRLHSKRAGGRSDTPKARTGASTKSAPCQSLKNALRSATILGSSGSRQFRDFDDYLLPAERFARAQACAGSAPGVSTRNRQPVPEGALASCWTSSWPTVTRLAKDNELPGMPIFFFFPHRVRG